MPRNETPDRAKLLRLSQTQPEGRLIAGGESDAADKAGALFGESDIGGATPSPHPLPREERGRGLERGGARVDKAAFYDWLKGRRSTLEGGVCLTSVELLERIYED